MADPESAGICDNCLKPLQAGQVILTWDDAEMHADCENPYSLAVEPQADEPAPRVLLGNPLLSYPLPDQART